MSALRSLAVAVMAVPRKFTDQLQAFCELADRLATTHDADAMLFLMERPTDWARLRQATGEHTVLLAGDTEETLEGAAEEDFDTILLNMPSEAPVYERLTQALLEARGRGTVAGRGVASSPCTAASSRP